MTFWGTGQGCHPPGWWQGATCCQHPAWHPWVTLGGGGDTPSWGHHQPWGGSREWGTAFCAPLFVQFRVFFRASWGWRCPFCPAGGPRAPPVASHSAQYARNWCASVSPSHPTELNGFGARRGRGWGLWGHAERGGCCLVPPGDISWGFCASPERFWVPPPWGSGCRLHGALGFFPHGALGASP